MQKFIDRQAEQEIFQELLLLQNDARLLTIEDIGGKGKTSLLRRLQYNCRWPPPAKPVSLIHLNELSDPNPFTLIETIRNELAPPESVDEIKFEVFDRFNKARIQHDFAPFDEVKTVAGVVDARGATVSGGIVTGSVGQLTQFQHVDVLQYTPGTPRENWTHPNQEEIARRECIKAFFEDLRTICVDLAQPVIILFDAWERCDTKLQEWIVNNVLMPHCFDMGKRPDTLVFVLAGRKGQIPAFQDMLQHQYDQLVKSIKALSEWEKEHVREFLKAHDYQDVNDEDLDFLSNKLKTGWSLEKALSMAQLIQAQ